MDLLGTSSIQRLRILHFKLKYSSLKKETTTNGNKFSSFYPKFLEKTVLLDK